MQTRSQAECHYQESKMMFWRQIACLTRTNSVAAHELLVMCVEGCRNDDDTNVSNRAKAGRAGKQVIVCMYLDHKCGYLHVWTDTYSTIMAHARP